MQVALRITRGAPRSEIAFKRIEDICGSIFHLRFAPARLRLAPAAPGLLVEAKTKHLRSFAVLLRNGRYVKPLPFSNRKPKARSEA